MRWKARSTGSFLGPPNEVGGFKVESIGHSKERIEIRGAKFPLNVAHHLLRKSCAFRYGGHGEFLLQAFLLENLGRIRTNRLKCLE